MKILYIITQADGGGAQKYVLTLAKHFGGSIACGNEQTSLFSDAKKLGIKTHSLKYLKRNIHPLFDLLAIWEIIFLVKKLKPEIVHLNSSKAGFLGSLIKPFVKTKIVFTAHGFIFNEPLPYFTKKFYLLLEKFASLFRDYIITVSDADKNSALANHLISKNKISTIYNGIGYIDFLTKQQARSFLNLNNEKFIIGTLANLYRTKGLDILIKSISQLNTHIRNKTQVIIIGEGPERDNLELEIKKHNLEKTIFLLGKIDNASHYLKAFDAFVLPSRKEGFPYAILEAMATGIPIIYFNVGGISEADPGIGINPEDLTALAQAIANIFTNTQMQKELSNKALERSKLFTEEKMLAETKNLYQKI